MGRISLLVTWLTLSALRLSAQSGSYSYLEFVENKGQWDSTVRLRAKMSAGELFMQQKGFTVLLHDTNDLKRIGELLHGDFAMAGVTPPQDNSARGGWAKKMGGQLASAIAEPDYSGDRYGTPVQPRVPAAAQEAMGERRRGAAEPDGRRETSGERALNRLGLEDCFRPFPVTSSHSYRVSFVNASDAVAILPEKAMPAYTNYFIGDKKNWTTHCVSYQGILYKNMYDGIDVHYYTDRGFLKYDIVMHPGADPSLLILQYDGQSSLSVRKNKLYVQTDRGDRAQSWRLILSRWMRREGPICPVRLCFCRGTGCVSGLIIILPMLPW